MIAEDQAQADAALKDMLLDSTLGGRVLMCVARASSVAAARDAAYRCVACVDSPTLFSRHDIAHQAL